MAKSLQEVRDTVARNLSAALADRGFTQKDLAEKFSISKAAASNWCRGEKKPKTETLLALAEWLSVPFEYFVGEGVFTNWGSIRADLNGFMDAVRTECGESWTTDVASVLYGIDVAHPEKASLSDLTYFIKDNFNRVELVNGKWVLGSIAKTSPPAGKSEKLRDLEAKAAFFNGADPTLTPEEQDAMWEDAKSYIQFKIQQRKGKQ